MFDPLRNDPRFQKLAESRTTHQISLWSTEVKKEIELEIAHVLFIDIVGYSKLLIRAARVARNDLIRSCTKPNISVLPKRQAI